MNEGASTRGRPAAAKRRLAVLLLVTGLVVASGAPVAQADTTLSSCSPAAFDAAVTAGGTVRFGLDCPSLVVSEDDRHPGRKDARHRGQRPRGGVERRRCPAALQGDGRPAHGARGDHPGRRGRRRRRRERRCSELPAQTAAAAPTARAAHPASRASRAARERPAVLEARARRAGPGAGPGAAPCSS